MALPFTHHEAARSPRTGDATTASVHHLHPPTAEGVSLDEICEPVTGAIEFDKEPRAIPGGTLEIGTYQSERASRRIGLYTPHNYNPDLPTVFMDTPLGTSAAGHNARVAGIIMAAGFKVGLKGPPRYPDFTVRGTPITEDANETLAFAQSLQEREKIPDHDRIYVYGESQAAMKGLATVALAMKYGFTVEQAHIVAACFFDKINWAALDRNARGFVRMGTGLLRAARELEIAALTELKGTLRHKDFHHHAVVIPRLIDGTTGKIIPLLPYLQTARVTAFGRDVYSHPQKVEERFERFPNIHVEVFRGRGHVDGILSSELAVSRGVLLNKTAQNYR